MLECYNDDYTKGLIVRGILINKGLGSGGKSSSKLKSILT